MLHAPGLPRLSGGDRDGQRRPRRAGRARAARSSRPATQLIAAIGGRVGASGQPARRRLLTARRRAAELAPVARARSSAPASSLIETVALGRRARLPGARARRRARGAARGGRRRVPDRARAGWSPPRASTSTPREFPEHVVEEQVPHSTALHARIVGRGQLRARAARPLRAQPRPLSPLALEAAEAAGLEPGCRNPFKSIVVRSVEMLYAADEALRLIDAYEPPDPPAARRRAAPPATARAGPRRRAGCCGTATSCDADGTDREATIVPPTSQNQASIEDDLRELRAGQPRAARRRAAAGAASRRSATTTPASPARPTSCAWRSIAAR